MSSSGGTPATAASAWNLKHMLAKRLLRELIHRSQGASAGAAGVVLVVDPHTSKILSSCLRMHDLLAAGVLVLQHLHLARERMDLPAVYFVEPTAEAFEWIAEDFPKPPPAPPAPPTQPAAATSSLLGALGILRGSSKSAAAASAAAAAAAAQSAAAAAAASKCAYACAHLFFTRSVSAKRMAWLASPACGMDMRRVKSFVELGADFLAFESRVFLFDRPHTIPLLYPLQPDPRDFDEWEQSAARNEGVPIGPPPPLVAEPSNAELLRFVGQLQSVCATVLAEGERPYVRYISPQARGKKLEGRSYLSQRFAELFDRELSKASKASSAAAGAFAPDPTPRHTTVLIVDRSLDPLTPLMHEFTFQAMINDILKVHGEIVYLHSPATQAQTQTSTPTQESRSVSGKDGAAAAAAASPADPTASSSSSSAAAPSSKPADDDVSLGELVLSEEDALWCSYRHRHIGTVLAGVNRALKDFARSNKMALYNKSAGNKPTDMKEILRAVSAMPEYKQSMRRYAKHLSLAEECLGKFKSRHLNLVGELEQSIASNSNTEGVVYPPDSRELREQLKALVLDRAPELEGVRPLGVVDKLRLVVIYALVQGGLPRTLKKVLGQSLHPDLIDSILDPANSASHLASMGAELDTFRHQLSRERVQELLERGAAESLSLMRYAPVLQGIMESMLRGQLPEEQFPYTRAGGAPPSSSSSAAAHSAAAAAAALNTSSSSSGMSAGSATTSNAGTPTLGSRRGSLLSTAASLLGLSDEEKLRRKKQAADAEADVAHRATGRSARRKAADMAAAASAAAARDNIMDDATAAAASSHSISSSSSSPSASPPHRYIVFMLGGLAFSEMRAAYEVAAAHGLASGSGVPDAPLLVGSTSSLTPAEFLLDLSGLTRKEFYDRVLESAGVAAAHSIATAGMPKVRMSEEERQERALADAVANSLKSAGKQGKGKGKGRGEEEQVTDSDEDDDEDEDDADMPESSGSDDGSSEDDMDSEEDAPLSRRNSADGGKHNAAASVPVKSSQVRRGASSTATAAASEVSRRGGATLSRKIKELVFESESDGEGDGGEEEPRRPHPPTSSSSAHHSKASKGRSGATTTTSNASGSSQQRKTPSASPALSPKASVRGGAATTAAATANGKGGKSRRVIRDDD